MFIRSSKITAHLVNFLFYLLVKKIKIFCHSALINSQYFDLKIYAGWKGKSTIRPFVNKEDRKHYLRLCGLDISVLGKRVLFIWFLNMTFKNSDF